MSLKRHLQEAAESMKGEGAASAQSTVDSHHDAVRVGQFDRREIELR